ncbi:RnfABCDGE type electron transport complex subunit G [Clostridium sp. ATCC 25772]|uniref:Ion-translocating oxidoreductase complex subunit G n=1 Tax=Clostridium senegalense TaxID=1465809 RepID=A0A6M0H6L0_9CLOT|nr:RnfABCDGE type electron transport complex subunit G [Clostridium sp. ATCC 25772]NEU06167.1 RnfABCDGE type electron transport complex subunit G [Clostridium senegalense]
MKENFKLGGILLIITAIAGLILSVAHSVTMGPILAKEKEEKVAAMKVILPEAEDFATVKDVEITEEILGVEAGTKNGKNVGYCINVSSKGYGGPINMMIGISEDGKIEGVQILSLSETPGLGSKAKEPEFIDQFKDKEATELSVDKESGSDDKVLAISGATITSKAVTAGVNNAVKLFNENLKGAQ